jgi:tRNA(Ile)-lysidine synthase
VPSACGYGAANGLCQYFDGDKLPPLLLRTRRAGDRMRPFGAPGSKPLKQVLIDKKIPRAERGALPLLACGEEIWWAVGVARGDGARIGPGTRDIIKITFHRL